MDFIIRPYKQGEEKYVAELHKALYIPLEQVAIQVNTDSEKIDILKEHLCKQRRIKLIKLPMNPNEAEPEYAQRIKAAFQNVHIFISSDTEEDVKIIRKIFKNWRNSR